MNQPSHGKHTDPNQNYVIKNPLRLLLDFVLKGANTKKSFSTKFTTTYYSTNTKKTNSLGGCLNETAFGIETAKQNFFHSTASTRTQFLQARVTQPALVAPLD